MRRKNWQLATCFGLLAPGLGFAQSAGAPPNFIPDAEYRANWGVSMINAQPAYLKGYTGKGVIVAVVDTGLDVDHAEFKNRISSALRNFGKDKPPNDVSHGIDESDGEIAGHGTHVSGIIGAARDGKGMQGVAYESTILPLRAVGVTGSDPNVDITNIAIKHAIDAGAKVLNGSYGEPDPPLREEKTDKDGNLLKDENGSSIPNDKYAKLNYQGIFNNPQSFEDTANTLREAARADMVLVFAAGNDAVFQPDGYSAIPSGPAMLPLINPENTKAGVLYNFIDTSRDDYDPNNPDTYYGFDSKTTEYAENLDFSDLKGAILAVVAVDKDGTIASYSNRCGAAAAWCLAAPGGDLQDGSHSAPYSTWPTSTGKPYKEEDGTSAAAPHVAGAAAVVRSAFPYFDARQTIETILTTTTKSGLFEDAAKYGQGLLNLGNAINGPGEFRYQGVFDVDTQGYDSVWTNAIKGVGDLTKRGNGILALTGKNTYTGGTTVLGGTLGVEGRVEGNVSVSDRGVLAGTGSVGNVTLSQGGMVSPGSTLDAAQVVNALTVTGEFIQGAASSYLAQLAADGKSDLIDVNGRATIDGSASVIIQPETSSTIRLNHRYTLISATGGVYGTYGTVVKPDTPFVDMNLIYDSRNMFLDLARSSVAFADIADSHNQRATGGAVEKLGANNAIYNSMLFLSDWQARNAFDQLSGEIHASIRAGLVEDSHFVRDAANDRLRAAFRSTGSASVSGLRYGTGAQSAAPAAPGEITFWGKGFGAWAQFKADGNAGRFRKSTGGFILGGDRFVGQNWRLGVLTGYSHTSFHANGRASSGSSDNFHLGLYAGTQRNAWNFRSGLGYTWHRIKTNRSVAFSDFSDKLSARYNAGTFQAFGELGYRVDTAVAALEPFANLSYVHFKAKHFSEDGGLASLSGKSQSNGNIFTTVGLRATSTFELGATEADVHGGIGWRHAFNRVNPKTDLSFNNQASFSVKGTPIAKNAVVLEAGLTVKMGKASSIGIAYQGQFGSGVREHGLEANVAVRF
ncbi:autotransporter domain-containing protein [Advenella mimigardefordensis]|uniref:Outer membrane autotransporter barrel domain-containing protein n=1 Tax=Advenella mimigardefordensis (strain DSM 17166 / LMG 22922 / DPN7) TaxID=1247726 RepID=W0P5H4_ADVMD|nr:autotransporter serine protease [Advenella mimigardefordensis]AHG62109.1 outer membrane autotransporter barrel domain-containing protein [Advenella mimigardefordensis DPN7]